MRNAHLLKNLAPAAFLALAAAAQADLSFPVDCRSTYLMTQSDSTTAPTVIRLADIGVGPGDLIVLTEKGVFAQSWGWSEDTDVVGGLFSKDNRFLDSSSLHRVPGAIKAGPALISPLTWNKQFFTDINEDFAVAPTGTRLVVPAGAQYLFLGAIDSSYGDNNSSKGLQVKISVIGKPSGKGRNALQRLLPTSAALTSGATHVAPNGLVAGWVSKGSVSQAAIFKGGNFNSSSIFGGTSAIAYSTDAKGNVVGSAATASGEMDPFIANGSTSLNPSNSAGSASAINANGIAVGYESIWGGFTYPFATVDGKAKLIDTSWNQGYATAINNQGDVVGYSIGSDWKPYGWISAGSQSSRKAIALPVSSTIGAYPTAINDKGQIAGNYVTPNNWTAQPYRQSVHGFVLDKSGFHDIGTLPGGDSVEVTSINNAGQIVGSATNADGETHAFLYDGGKMVDLGTLDGTSSYAASINDAGQIVGTALDAQGNFQAFSTNAKVQPIGVSAVRLSNNYFPEGSTVTGTIAISGAAPVGGLTIDIAVNQNGLVNLPSQVTIPAGQNTVTFSISANAANANTPFVLTASTGTQSVNSTATVRSLTLSDYRLSKYTTQAGTSLAGSLQLEATALTGGKTIKFWSDNAGVSVTNAVTIAAGTQNGTFNVKVGSIAAGTKVIVYAQCGDRQSQTSFQVVK